MALYQTIYMIIDYKIDVKADLGSMQFSGIFYLRRKFAEHRRRLLRIII